MASPRVSQLKVVDLMAAPLALPESSSVRDAALFLARGGTPVIPTVSSDGTFVGVLAEADIHRRLSEVTRGFYSPEEFRTCVPFLAGPLPESMGDKFARVGWQPVAEVRREIRPLGPGDSLTGALDAMRQQGVSALPVLENGKLVGILHADALTLRLAEFAVRPTREAKRGRADRRGTEAPAPRRAPVPQGP